MLNFKPIHFLLVFKIDFSKNINESLDKDFIYLYQSYVAIHI